MDVKKEMCEEITGNQTSIATCTYMTFQDSEIFPNNQMCSCIRDHIKCEAALTLEPFLVCSLATHQKLQLF